MRKNSFNNRSQQGALTQSVLMSVSFTKITKSRLKNCIEVANNLFSVFEVRVRQLEMGWYVSVMFFEFLRVSCAGIFRA